MKYVVFIYLRESLKQMIALIAGIAAMASVALFLDEHNLPSWSWLGL